jgi:hypothetical protein
MNREMIDLDSHDLWAHILFSVLYHGAWNKSDVARTTLDFPPADIITYPLLSTLMAVSFGLFILTFG